MAARNLKSRIDQFIVSQVKKFREEEGLSQVDLSVHLDISYGYIGHIESPKYRAKYNIKHLNELAKLFKCSPKDFFPEKPI